MYPFYDACNSCANNHGACIRCTGNFELHDVPIDLCHRNLIYSTFLQAASEPQRLQEVEATINTQMDMYVLNPLAFVHPPPRPIA